MLERILELMKQQNINKNQLANLSKVPRTTIYSALSSEENCKKTKLETMRPIAAALNTTLDYIISGNDTQKLDESFNPNTIISIGRNGTRVVYEIDDKDAQLVESFLEKLKKDK